MSRENAMKRDGERAEGIHQRPAIAPAVDVYENQDELLVIADVPGATREQMTLHLEKGQLTIEARRTETKEGGPLAAEYRAFDYRRTFLIPQGVDAEKIVADLRDGVLQVHLPKVAALRPRQIPIRSP